MASNASHMLEAALEQMDDIIAGSKAMVPVGDFSDAPVELRSTDCPAPLRVLQLAEELKVALEVEGSSGAKEALRRQVPSATTHALLLWLNKGPVNLQSLGNNESYQDRLARLEGHKESLVLQVSVLTDQVEAQGEKIRDLENSLEEHHQKLSSTEEMLQQELRSRTSLESQKLDLMDEVSYLKLKLVGMEEKQSHNTERQHKAESVVNLISELQEQMCRIQLELHSKIREKQAAEMDAEGGPGGHGSGPAQSLACETEEEVVEGPDPADSDSELSCGFCGRQSGLLQELRLLRDKVNELEDEKSQYERKLKATKAEISNLQHLLLTKKTEIEHLQAQLLSRAPVSMDSAERDQELQRLKTGMESLIAANEEKDRRIEELTILLSQCRQFREVTVVMPVARERVLTGSSEDGRMNGDVRMRSFSLKAHSELSSGSSPVLPSPLSNQRDNESRLQPRLLSSSMEDLQSASTQKNLQNGTLVEPAENQNRDESLTPPGQRSLPEPKRASDSSDSSAHKTPDESEDGDFSLRKTEKTDDTTSSDVSPMSSGADSGQQSPVAQENKNNKSIKKLWGKIRRTQSGGLNGDDLGPTEFRRGGLRATAGPRLARTPDSGSSVCDKNTPFSKWTREQVCGWLEDFGLGQYVNLSRQWIESGQTLLSATPQDFEKEMGIKHPLHRKKLQLAMRTFSTKMMEKYSEVDPIWVTRWLDDIGLPQYKDQFHESRVDGRMLQYLTVNDLLFLKVTSQLHHLSIKCAIHVLHVNKFNPYCLRRRPGDENKTSPSEVVQWSNHRVMEWLRSVDLAEYAPNLRGSGVHGGLIILEPRFNSDTLAMLLNIPPQKTLLRRHLATNFTSLVGPQAQQEKREYATATGHTPLTTTAKVRPKKLGFTHFGHLRKRRPDDSADYICPIDTASLLSVNGGPHRPYGSFRGLSPIRDTDTDTEKVEQVGSKF
ncbi:liprin-beta-2 isoform X3 [Denticeps clupeoides]|uniref:liprin-beta-2 isoform X3 n=1 Tax=Denticeps clupeoides TaxID=299321 RepID=UPI0010A37C91|nr:liprin-beta-2-like isoform X3 [Denticeps clupeoides]